MFTVGLCIIIISEKVGKTRLPLESDPNVGKREFYFFEN